jgi:hypothetical protein
MSFYSVIMRRRNGETENGMATRIGKDRSTFRQWRFCEPTAIFIAEVADALGERPGDLFEEYVSDYRETHEPKTESD